MPELQEIKRQDLFVSGTTGYHTFRIPSLLVTSNGTILAFCEGRVHNSRDDGEIHLLLRRSTDGGHTWGPQQVVIAEPGMTCGNPCPVQDAATGDVVLLFCKNHAERGENLICAGEAERTVWLTRSSDDGASWSAPVDITAAVKRESWTWYATGPGHGIQLTDGRLVIPCDHVVGRDFRRSSDPHHSHVIVSDDHGYTWTIGGIAAEGTNECSVVELEDGSIYLNARGTLGLQCRAIARSADRGASFSGLEWDSSLPEPVCQGSLIRSSNGQILFANPASATRDHLTVRTSMDACETWSAGIVLQPGPAAYSDLAIAADGNVLCLFEEGPYQTLTLARIPSAQFLHP